MVGAEPDTWPERHPLTTEDVLAVVRPDRAALPSVGAGGSLVAMTVRLRRDSAPQSALGDGRTDAGLPVEAAQGQRVRVWRVGDGSWFEPLAEWPTSWGASWSPDRRRLAAYVHRGPGAPTVALWNSDDGKVVDLDISAGPHFTFERPQWVLDGAALAVETLHHDDSVAAAPLQHDLAVRVLRSEPEAPRARNSPRLDSSGLTLVGLDGFRRILAADWTVRAWRVSPDGAQLACLRLADFNTDRYETLFDLTVINLQSGAVSTLARGIRQSYGLGLSWSPDGARLAFVTNVRGRPDALWVVDSDGRAPARMVTDGEGRWTSRGHAAEIGGYQAPRWLGLSTLAWHQDGSGFLTVQLGTGEDASTTIAAVSTASSTAFINTPEGEDEQWLLDHDSPAPLSSHSVFSVRNSRGAFCLDRLDLVGGGRTTITRRPGSVSTSQLHVSDGPDGGAFIVVTPEQPGEIWLTVPSGARRLAALNPDLPACHTAHRISWVGRSGGAAGVLVPTGVVPKDGWPTIVCVYGGSKLSSLAERFDPDEVIHAGLLTSRGWAVVYPDLPMTETDPMGQFAPMVRETLDQVDRQIPLDRQRLAVMGSSYGSFTAVSLLVTAPSTFKTAVITAPLINPIASYAAMREDGSSFEGFWENGQGRMGVPPWADPQRWVDNTPFLHLDRVTAAVLIGVGNHGVAGEVAQGEQFFAGLRRLGRQVELRHYGGEGHAPSSWSPQAYSDFADRAISWIAACFDQPT